MGREVYEAGHSMMSEISSHESPGKQAAPLPAVSVVVPVLNEAGNILPLVNEIIEALSALEDFEIIYVDDGSTDETPNLLADLTKTVSELHFIRHQKRAGQSAAIWTGVGAASFPLIATLDGDGQNVPANIPDLIHLYLRDSAPDGKLMVAGWRTGRRDSWSKKVASKIANGVRSAMLGDNTPDTGCGLKVFRRADYLSFPTFNHMHRFLPALMIRTGGRVISADVAHRPRQQGVSNYGVFDRLWVGISDLFGVAWLTRRTLSIQTEKITSGSQEPVE